VRPGHESLHIQVAEKLRRNGQRYTTLRRDIVGELMASSRPLSVSELLAAKRGRAQSSLYRNLSVLIAAGVVDRVAGMQEDTARYELAEFALGHHHHLVCMVCGDIVDVAFPTKLESDLERGLRDVTRRAGYVLDHHRLDVIGRCRRCR
jgi:Fe2+ or Zn2+ uptake regulation protein